MSKAETLIEALPYIKKFNGKTFVIKYGGSVMEDENLSQKFIEDIALLKLVGLRIIIVHGGGKRINARLDSVDLDVQFIQGHRVTSEAVMDIVEEVLSGSVNKELSAKLSEHGILALGMSGRDSNLLLAEKKYAVGEDGEPLDIGNVGKITKVNTEVLNSLLDADYVPIISPVARGANGERYNVNADTAAGAIAGAVNAEKLILLSDVKGLYKDIKDEDSFISSIDIATTKQYIEEGIINGGMIPKMNCCMDALDRGTEQVAIIDGRIEHSLLMELFTRAGVGTMVTK